VLKRNSMRFAAALLAALAIFVASPNAALAAAPQHHDQLQPQGVHVWGSFSSSGELREIPRENNASRSGWSDPGKDALTFFDLNCADNNNNTSGELREW
jgi:hypothetical protein